MNIIYKLDNYHNNKSYYFHVLPNCEICNIIKNNEIWEKYMHAVFEKYITCDSIVVECGCHVGIHTLKIASLCKKLYAFEPMPETNKVLNLNLKLNNIENVVVFNEGVSDKHGMTKFSWIMSGNPGGAGLDNNPMGMPSWIQPCTETIHVKLTTIDSLSLNRLDFMKIDVEGYESLAICGAMETIKRFKPVIIMEVWMNHNGGVDINYTRTLFKDLLDIGYEVTQVAGPDFLFTPV